MFQCKHIHMNTYNHAIIPYKQKYWQCLILVWPQTNMIKILAKFKFEHCACVYQGVLPSSHLKYLKVCKFTRNITGSVLVLSWLYLQLTYWSASRGQERDCMHYVIMCWGRNNNNIGRFYFGGFSLNYQTAKFHQIFWLFGIY